MRSTVGASTSSGLGEEVVRICGTHTVIEQMRFGRTPEEACREAIGRIVKLDPVKAKGEIVDEDINFTLDSEACVEAMTFYDSFFEEGLAQPTVSDVPVEAQFADGTVGSFISGPWMIGIVTDAGADPETWAVAHQPTAVSGTSFVGGSNLAVFEQSDNQEAAWGLHRVLVAPGSAGRLVRDGE